MFKSLKFSSSGKPSISTTMDGTLIIVYSPANISSDCGDEFQGVSKNVKKTTEKLPFKNLVKKKNKPKRDCYFLIIEAKNNH